MTAGGSSLVESVSALYASSPEFDRHFKHILSWRFSPSSAASMRGICQLLLMTEHALSTGKLHPKGLPRNTVII